MTDAVRCFSVTGYSGGSVLVRSWKPWHKNSAKYMQKLQNTKLINNSKHDQWINEGRFTLFCNENENLMIYIKELVILDAGRYRIEVDGQWFIDMTLNVEEGQ